MGAKLEEFEARQKTLDEHRKTVAYHQTALQAIEDGDRIFIEGMLVGKEVRATIREAVKRELINWEYLVATLEDDLEERLR